MDPTFAFQENALAYPNFLITFTQSTDAMGRRDVHPSRTSNVCLALCSFFFPPVFFALQDPCLKDIIIADFALMAFMISHECLHFGNLQFLFHWHKYGSRCLIVVSGNLKGWTDRKVFSLQIFKQFFALTVFVTAYMSWVCYMDETFFGCLCDLRLYIL